MIIIKVNVKEFLFQNKFVLLKEFSLFVCVFPVIIGLPSLKQIDSQSITNKDREFAQELAANGFSSQSPRIRNNEDDRVAAHRHAAVTTVIEEISEQPYVLKYEIQSYFNINKPYFKKYFIIVIIQLQMQC